MRKDAQMYNRERTVYDIENVIETDHGHGVYNLWTSDKFDADQSIPLLLAAFLKEHPGLIITSSISAKRGVTITTQPRKK